MLGNVRLGWGIQGNFSQLINHQGLHGVVLQLGSQQSDGYLGLELL